MVSGQLLAPERMLAIARLNLGLGGGRRDAYLRSLARRPGG